MAAPVVVPHRGIHDLRLPLPRPDRRRALIALVLLAADVAIALGWWRVRRRPHRLGLAALALAALAAGGWQVAEAGAASHNHLCHAHNSDSCGHTHDEDGHTQPPPR